MATIPLYEIGRDTTTLTLQKMVPGSDGVLASSGSALDLYATVEENRVVSDNRLVNISPMKRRARNNVIVESGTSMTFQGVILKKTTGNNARTLGYTADYVRAQWAEGSATWDFYAILGRYEQTTNKEGSRYTLTLEHIDDLADAGNPIVTNP